MLHVDLVVCGAREILRGVSPEGARRLYPR